MGLSLVVGDFQTLIRWVIEIPVAYLSGQHCCLLANVCLERQLALLLGAVSPAFLCPRRPRLLPESG